MEAAPTGDQRRPVRLETYAIFFGLFGAVVFLTHAAFLKLPYFWDEVGRYVPAARELGNGHAAADAPGLAAYLAAFWRIAGYSVAATRIAMLLAATGALLAAFLLAIRLSENLRGAPAFLTVVWLVCSPLFYAQAMLANPEMPAMLLTAAALVLFLVERPLAAAMAATGLALVNANGLAVAVALGVWLWTERGVRQAAYFLIPAAALAAWLAAAHRVDPREMLHPAAFALAVARGLYFLCIADFHWIGTLAIIFALRRSDVFRGRAWRVTGWVALVYMMALGFHGGAMLERMTLPLLPIVYTAMAAGFSTYRGGWKIASQWALAAGLAVSNFWNPPYPFPLDNNLAFTDFVKLQQTAAEFIEFRYAERRVVTAWPLGSALGRPEFGYVRRPMEVREIPAFREANLRAVNWSGVGVLVLYSRGWDPEWNVCRVEPVRRFCRHFFGYEPQAPAESYRGPELQQVGHWSRRGQWVDVYEVAGAPEKKGLLAGR